MSQFCRCQKSSAFWTCAKLGNDLNNNVNSKTFNILQPLDYALINCLLHYSQIPPIWQCWNVTNDQSLGLGCFLCSSTLGQDATWRICLMCIENFITKIHWYHDYLVFILGLFISEKVCILQLSHSPSLTKQNAIFLFYVAESQSYKDYV